MKKLLHAATFIALMAALVRPTHTSERSPRVTSDNLQKAQSYVRYRQIMSTQPNADDQIATVVSVYNKILVYRRFPWAKPKSEFTKMPTIDALANNMQNWSPSQLARAFCPIKRIELRELSHKEYTIAIGSVYPGIFGFTVQPNLLADGTEKDFALSEAIYKIIKEKRTSVLEKRDAFNIINSCIDGLSNPPDAHKGYVTYTPEQKLYIKLLRIMHHFNRESPEEIERLQRLHLVNAAYFLEKNVPKVFENQTGVGISGEKVIPFLLYVAKIVPDALPHIMWAIRQNEYLSAPDKEQLLDAVRLKYIDYRKTLPSLLKEGLPSRNKECDIQEIPDVIQEIMIKYAQ